MTDIRSSPISYLSTSKLLNHKFQISNMFTHFFIHQKVIPRRIQRKYFDMIRSCLIERITLLSSRGNSTTTSNRQTKTFFSFTYKKYRFAFSIYTPCNHHYDTALNNSWVFKCSTTHLDNIESYYKEEHTSLCLVPSPIILSSQHRACAMHQNILFNPSLLTYLEKQQLKSHDPQH